MMRLEFINPVYFPTLTESFLRRDFDFALYLGNASAKILNDFFSTTFACYLILMVVTNCLKFVPWGDGAASQIFYFAMPIIFFFGYFLLF